MNLALQQQQQITVAAWTMAWCTEPSSPVTPGLVKGNPVMAVMRRHAAAFSGTAYVKGPRPVGWRGLETDPGHRASSPLAGGPFLNLRLIHGHVSHQQDVTQQTIPAGNPGE